MKMRTTARVTSTLADTSHPSFFSNLLQLYPVGFGRGGGGDCGESCSNQEDARDVSTLCSESLEGVQAKLSAKRVLKQQHVVSSTSVPYRTRGVS